MKLSVLANLYGSKSLDEALKIISSLGVHSVEIGAGGYSAGEVEAKQWINAVINGTKPTVLPEQAYCVTQILEGIYESAKTGKPFYFEN